ncbi:hypothetical protein QE152_g13502 [Popillia japonica]|uniref:Uncharacterized protein n=1 Tax=Popillia japonica TaxID=7064 RepID=A0AAW1LCN8_POPJA
MFFERRSYDDDVIQIGKYVRFQIGSAPITLSIKRCQVAGALCKPNGILLNWKRPLFGTVKAVYGLLASAIGISQYADLISRVVRYLESRSLSKIWDT